MRLLRWKLFGKDEKSEKVSLDLTRNYFPDSFSRDQSLCCPAVHTAQQGEHIISFGFRFSPAANLRCWTKDGWEGELDNGRPCNVAPAASRHVSVAEKRGSVGRMRAHLHTHPAHFIHETLSAPRPTVVYARPQLGFAVNRRVLSRMLEESRSCAERTAGAAQKSLTAD